MTSRKPFYRVVRAFQQTYDMRKGRAVYRVIVCLSCGHWREIKTSFTVADLRGRLFTCGHRHD